MGWHTDRHYWRTCSSQEMLTAWVPFHDISGDHGPVMFVAGSHRWSDQIDLSFWDQDLTAIDRYAAEHGARIVTATLRRGQVSFHHCGTLHGSGPNQIPSPAGRSPSTSSPETTATSGPAIPTAPSPRITTTAWSEATPTAHPTTLIRPCAPACGRSGKRPPPAGRVSRKRSRRSAGRRGRRRRAADAGQRDQPVPGRQPRGAGQPPGMPP